MLHWGNVSKPERESAKRRTEMLLEGSRFIDRKRAEIRALVHMLISHVHGGDWQENTCIASTDRFQWRVYSWQPGNHLTIAAVYYTAGRGEQVYTSGPDDSMSYVHVELVHDHLPVLLQGLLQEVPGLGSTLRPILLAGER